MATFEGTIGATDPQGAIVGTFVVKLHPSQNSFCQVCPSDAHPQVPACEWLVAQDTPDLNQQQLDTLTVHVEGTGSWRITWVLPNGPWTGTLTAADGPQDIPTVGQGPKKVADLTEAHYGRVT